MSDMLLAMLLTLKDMASGPLGQVQGKVKKFSHDLMAVGVTSRALGQTMLNAMQAPIQAFMEAEDAATRLKTATMKAGGIVSKDFAAMEKLAVSLGNKLPGTAAQMENMFAALSKGGVSTQDILGGVGEAAGNLAVVLNMDFVESANFASRTSKAMGIAAKDMTGWMDTVQKMSHLGNISVTDMGYAFAKSGDTLKSIGIAGKQAADSFAPIMAQLMEAGDSGETVGTNLSSMLTNLKLFEMGTDKQFSKARASLKGMGVELDVFDKMGKLRGPRELVEQLGKLKSLAPEKQLKAMRDIFGGGMDEKLAQKLIGGGGKAYDDYLKRMQEQASLNERINEILKSLTNMWESAQGAFETTLGKWIKTLEPELKKAAKLFGDLSDKVGELIEKHPDIAKFAAATMLLGGGALLTGGTALMGIGMAASGIAPAAKGIGMVADGAKKLGKHGKDAALSMKIWNASAGANLVAAANKPVPVPKFSTMFKSAFSSVGNAAKSFGSSLSNAFARMFLQVSLIGEAFKMKFPSIMRGIGGSIKLLPGMLTKIPGAIGSAFGKIPGLLTRVPMLLRAVALGIRAVGLAAIGNPVGLVIAGIAVAAVLVFKYWKPIAGFFKGLWQGLMIGLKPLKPAFDAAFAAVAPIIQPIVGALKSVWNWVKSLLSPVNDTGGAAEKMGKKFGLALAEMISKGQEMLAHFMALPEKLLSIGTNMMMGLLNGITAGAGRVLAKIGEIASNIASKFANIMGIHSPSRVFMGFGQNLGAGLELGMVAKAAGIAGAAKKLAIAATPNMPKLAAPGLALASAKGGAGGGHQITFAPTIQLMAGPGMSSEQQMQQAVRELYPEFKRLMDRYSHDKKRANA